MASVGALPLRRLILTPVRHPELHLLNAVTASGIVFERHPCERPVVAIAAHLRLRDKRSAQW